MARVAEKVDMGDLPSYATLVDGSCPSWMPPVPSLFLDLLTLLRIVLKDGRGFVLDGISKEKAGALETSLASEFGYPRHRELVRRRRPPRK